MSKCITPEATLSYPAIFEPKADDHGNLKFSATFVFAPGADLSALRAEAERVGREKFGAKYDTLKKSSSFKTGFRDDAEAKGYEEGSIYINASSKQQPGVVSRYAGKDGKPAAITDPAELYPGAKVRASLRAFAFDKDGNKGVSWGLQNIQKLGEGQRIDGRMKAEDEFEATEGAASDMDDLLN